MIKYIKFTAVVSLIFILVVISSACGLGKPEHTEQAEISQSSFGEVFTAFAELRDVSDELLNEPPTEQEWWIKFGVNCEDVDPILEENRKLIEQGNLSEVDFRLANALANIMKNYKDAYEVMEAAQGNSDSEIIDYAYKDFSAKIANANVAWDQELAAVIVE